MNRTKKILLTILSVFLILGGWFLEVYYYQFRFVGDGTSFWISIIIGSLLTLLLTGLFLLKHKSAKFGRLILIGLSVWFTWAGQNYSYNESLNLNSVENTSKTSIQDKYKQYTSRINQIEKDIQNKNNLLPDNLKDRTYLNKNGVQPLLLEIQELNKNLKYYESLRDDLDLSTLNVVKKSAYEMLADDLGFNSPTPLKLISQALLSLFIALMAPTGIKIIEVVNGKVKPVVKSKKDLNKQIKAPIKDELTKVSNSRFYDQENPPSLKSREGVVSETGISFDKFNKLRKLEIKLNLTEKVSGLIVPKVGRSEYIMFMRNKKVYCNELTAVR